MTKRRSLTSSERKRSNILIIIKRFFIVFAIVAYIVASLTLIGVGTEKFKETKKTIKSFDKKLTLNYTVKAQIIDSITREFYIDVLSQKEIGYIKFIYDQYPVLCEKNPEREYGKCDNYSYVLTIVSVNYNGQSLLLKVKFFN
jgi:hypothetical protein